METLRILFALALPVLLGGWWLGLLVPRNVPARTWVVWGNGALAGLLLLPLLMRLLDALGLSLHFGLLGSTAACLAALALAVRVILRSPQALPLAPTLPAPLPAAQRVVIAVLAALILLRLLTLCLEVYWRPLFPWDATMHWATKARVWSDAGAIIPFVDNDRWLELGGQGVYTDHHPYYPITTPLLQVWMSSALGRWDESLINLPWPLCLAALGAAFYGQARVAGAGALNAAVFTWFLFTMPLLNTHIALAGYADFFLGACYCAAVMAFYNWYRSRRAWQALLAALFAASCPLVKNEGFYWLLSFGPGLVLVLLPRRRGLALLGGGLLALFLLLAFFPPDLVVAGHSLANLDLHFRNRVPGALAVSFWVHDNWHLFAWFLVALGIARVCSRRSPPGDYAGLLAVLGSAVALFLILFLYTRYSWGAIRFSAVGRIGVQLVPALLFLTLLLARDLLSPQRAEGERLRTPAYSR